MMGIQMFRSFEDAVHDMEEWVKTFPERYDLVVGIPRSGLFVASYIATKLGIPLSTPDNFVRNEIWFTSVLAKPTEINKILLVDDGVGRKDGQMKQHFDRIKSAFPNIAIRKASLYIYKDAVEAVDLYYDYLDNNRLNREEWNLLHRKYGVLGVDMDGVLCHDWDPARYKTYEEFLQNTEPYMIPKYNIDFIITSRNKKYARETVEWLKKNGVSFNTLIMSDGPTSAMEFKAKCLMQYPCDWFWESNYAEALIINKVVGIAVLSIEGMKLIRQKRT